MKDDRRQVAGPKFPDLEPVLAALFESLREERIRAACTHGSTLAGSPSGYMADDRQNRAACVKKETKSFRE
jgi:hypothetical protein